MNTPATVTTSEPTLPASAQQAPACEGASNRDWIIYGLVAFASVVFAAWATDPLATVLAANGVDGARAFALSASAQLLLVHNLFDMFDKGLTLFRQVR